MRYYHNEKPYKNFTFLYLKLFYILFTRTHTCTHVHAHIFFKYPMKCDEFQISKAFESNKNLRLSRPFLTCLTCLMEYI